MGRRAKPPAARLQFGLRSVSTGRHSEAPTRIAHVPVLELGLGGRDSGSLFIAGRPAQAIERKLGVDARTQSTAMLVGAVVFLAVGLLVITNLDGLDTDD
jgi:hypothetical protein